MKKRTPTSSGYWSDKELDARSFMAKLSHDGDLIQGSVVKMKRVCGTPGCKCIQKGQKHVSMYLALRYKGKRKMICIPRHLEDKIKTGIKNYRKLMTLLAAVSVATFERISSHGDGD